MSHQYKDPFLELRQQFNEYRRMLDINGFPRKQTRLLTRVIGRPLL